MKQCSGLMRFHWALFLSACLRMVSADCGSDCAYCSVHLRLQQTRVNSIECVLQCKGHLSTGGSWGICEDFLQTTESTPEAVQLSTETYNLPQQHPEEKKYGGFMKRYGGFMKRYGGFMKRYGGFMKKAAEDYGPQSDEIDQGREILSKSDMEMLANLVEHDAERKGPEMKDIIRAKGEDHELEGMVKHYGGFMRRDYDLGVEQNRYRNAMVGSCGGWAGQIGGGA